MCGICGAVSTRHLPLRAGAAAGVAAMLGALAHRGPDASGFEESEAAVIGATRLAIRGLSDGRQPITDAATGITAVCNGELDNHRELRQWLASRRRPVAQATDVAVIPGLYLEVGEDFAEHLLGSFAIALWDPRRELLVLARDPAGERPLFFQRQGGADEDNGADGNGGEVVFATELAALAAFSHPQTFDPEGLACYLRFGCFPAPATPFAGVQKVGPGERVAIDADGVRRKRYWRWRVCHQGAALMPGPRLVNPSRPRSAEEPFTPPYPLHTAAEERAATTPPMPPMPPNASSRAASSEATADHGREGRPASRRSRLDQLDEVFRRAVLRQTDVEVACGVFLSGGIDSSLVTAVARALRPDRELRAFTLRFSESSYDEGDAAERVAAALGLTATPVWVRPEDFPARLPELVRRAGEPLADPAWVPAALLARRASDEVKTALVGEGGDELFGGYPTYTGVWLAERYLRLPAALRRGLERVVRALPPSDKKVTLGFLLKRFIAGASLDGFERHLRWTSNLPPELLARLGSRAARSPVSEVEGSLLERVQQHDLETALAEGLLTKADRASMQSAVELRAPFLDREVMEFAASLTAQEKVSGFRTKVLLKEYASRYLPRWIVHRRKRGLSVPLASWLRGPLAGWAHDKLASGILGTVGLDQREALALFEEHRGRQADHARALWTLIVLSEWLEWASDPSAP